MTGRFDVHTHLLPGIDDGCRDYAQSLQCARTLVEHGYSDAFCTPHVWPSLPNNHASSICDAVRNLQMRLDAEKVGLKVHPGAELNLHSLWPQIKAWKDAEVVTYGLAGKWVLFDFWLEDAGDFRMGVQPAMEHLLSRGFSLVLAHPERISVLQENADILDRVEQMGVKLQLNSWCLADSAHREIQETAQRLLGTGKYFLMGTDLHGPGGMRSRMKGIELAEEMVGTEAVKHLMVDHPRKLIGS